MIRTQIQLTEEQARALRALAARSGVSMAELIRQGITPLLQSPVSGDAERRRRAKAIAGRFRSGATDLSTNHDAYLAETYAE